MELIDPKLMAVVRGAIVLVAGTVLAHVLARGAARLAGRRASPQQTMLIRRFGFYGLMILVLMTALRELGFDLSVLLGAAGILTVALGFASQASASNLISGLFLIGERPFVIGDMIRVGGTTGYVEAIDLLSVKIRTFDNLFVRVPNETLLKAEITNLSYYPIRRVDVQLGIAYKEDIRRVREALLRVADMNPLCLDEPAPLLIIAGFGDSAVQLQFSVWASAGNFLRLKNSIQEEIKAAFDSAGLEIPFPHRTLYAGRVTDPFPVRIVDAAESGAPVKPQGD